MTMTRHTVQRNGRVSDFDEDPTSGGRSNLDTLKGLPQSQVYIDSQRNGAGGSNVLGSTIASQAQVPSRAMRARLHAAGGYLNI